ncbi:hypothetical protein PBAC_10020 [Pedobacter glucosidilyticus]|nr:hypothetical protein PBAC_10020 [Pedobacter glucosidilyticus]
MAISLYPHFYKLKNSQVIKVQKKKYFSFKIVYIFTNYNL